MSSNFKCMNDIKFYFIDSVKFLDIKSLKDVIPQDDQILAENLKLPLSFFLYKSKPPCKGCVGCENNFHVIFNIYHVVFVFVKYLIKIFRQKWRI